MQLMKLKLLFIAVTSSSMGHSVSLFDIQMVPHPLAATGFALGG